MKKNKKTIYIHDDVLQTKDEDTFGHLYIAEAVVESLENMEPPYIIGIFGGWGTGKSSLLHMISGQLSDSEYKKVNIDAWRYTSSTNLSRSFLVHVANAIDPDQVYQLQRKLFDSEQEVILPNESIFDKFRDLRIKDLFKPILKLLGVFLFVFLCITLGVIIWFLIFNPGFEWSDILGQVFDLAYIPTFITFLESLNLYFIQRPVTVTHERIDADEIFERYFDTIVETAVNEGICVKKKKLVIIVDNLDRLTEEKMVEALESLKTYISNKDSVFIVACDDNVVRRVINNSTKLGKEQGNNNKAGEHYLDKFFQQTFRLPEYMILNLHEYAFQNFSKTRLFEDLNKKGTDIRELVSIILPSDISSPRKVKRLLNEFIALYKIVEGREKKIDGQLRPGTLTDNLKFLAKFSTLRAEYSGFYNVLLTNSHLLEEVNLIIRDSQQNNTKDILIKVKSESLHHLLISDNQSLLKYLIKTQTIVPNVNIQTYIWLSQDVLALGLQKDHYDLLREGLQNGDISQVTGLLNNLDDKEGDYATLLCRVSERLLEERLNGLERENGCRVLANILSTLPKNIQSEIANSLARLIPNWNLSVFPSKDILNILTWENSASNEEKVKLLNKLIERLGDQETYQSTFKSILNCARIIQDNGFESHVQEWIQSLLQPPSGLDEEGIIDNKKDIDWIISTALDYKDNDLVISTYFSNFLVDYLFSRVDLVDSKVTNTNRTDVNLDTDLYFRFLEMIKDFIRRGGRSDSYWKGVIELMTSTKSLDIYNSCSQMIRELDEYIPNQLIDQTKVAIINGISNVEQLKETDQDFNQWLKIELGFIFILQRKQDEDTDNESNRLLNFSFRNIVNKNSTLQEASNFIIDFTNEFGIEISNPYLFALFDVYETKVTEESFRQFFSKVITSLDQKFDPAIRRKVVECFNKTFIQNNELALNILDGFVGSFIQLRNYDELFQEFGNQWLNLLHNEPINIVKIKISILERIRKAGLLPTDSIVKQITSLIPYGGDTEKLEFITRYLTQMKEEIISAGPEIFKKIISNIASFSTNKDEVLLLVANWVNESADINDLNLFKVELKNLFILSPESANEILANFNVWQIMSEEDASELIIDVYNKPESNFRRKNAKESIKKFSDSNRVRIVMNVWNALQPVNTKKLFIQDIIDELNEGEISSLREETINNIRGSGASESAELNLSLLEVAITNDVHEIMPVVNLFVTLLGSPRDEIDLAIRHIVSCLASFRLRKDHKSKLISAIKDLQKRYRDDPELLQQLKKVIESLKLNSWSLKDFWE